MGRKNIISLLWMTLILLLVLALANWQPRQTQAAFLFHKVKLAEAQHQPEEAAQALRQLLAAQPWRTDLNEQIGNFLDEAGDWAGAAAAYESAFKQQTLSTDGSLRLAELWVEAGQDDKAKQLLLALTTSKNLASTSDRKSVV